MSERFVCQAPFILPCASCRIASFEGSLQDSDEFIKEHWSHFFAQMLEAINYSRDTWEVPHVRDV